MRCPVCRAENVESICRRCRADLSLLVSVERERQRLLAAASLAIASGDGQEALLHARAAQSMRHGEDADRLLALSHLVCRHYSAAWATYKNIQIRKKVAPQTIDRA
jgi:hypothetical protein